MNEKEKVNQITEGVIWKQLLLFFFPTKNTIQCKRFSNEIVLLQLYGVFILCFYP